MRTIAAVTVGRSDYGIYLPILRKIEADKQLKLHLIVAGAHLSPAFGETVKLIEADAFKIGDRVEMLLSSDSPEAVAKSMGLGVIGFSQTYTRSRPDILLALGDRFEMHAAVVAALPFRIPVAHIHGGELTYGAIDDSLRHSISKLSHLHFVSTDAYARRVEQLGEEPWRITVSGAPSLDNLRSVRLLNREQFSRRYNLGFKSDFLLVTYHPVTLEHENTEKQFRALLAALGTQDKAVLFTLANADTGGQVINRMIQEFVETHARAKLVENLGTQGYLSAMALAAAMVGNTSSGIIEAASFNLPVVNIGNRQRGRIKGANVIDCACERSAVLGALNTALSAEFRASIATIANPYGDGGAAQAIVKRLRTVPLDQRLITKEFHDL